MKLFSILFVVIISQTLNAQFEYEPSKQNPYGQLNPTAPEQTGNFAQLMGSCKCKSESRNPDQSWAKPIDMIWNWKYIMNGMAVQDESLKADGKHSGSIRQYNQDSAKWYVHYYTSKSPGSSLSSWSGNKTKDGDIVLFRDQKAPNGTEGYSRLTFYDINKDGYKWLGEWIDKSGKIVFPFWKISCKRIGRLESKKQNQSCIERIIEKDNILGSKRNNACKTISLSATINQYVDEMKTLDFESCPSAFSLAFKNHITAWANMVQLTDKYPNLRGEMHELFDTIKIGKDTASFERLLNDIWMTWSEVEKAMK